MANSDILLAQGLNGIRIARLYDEELTDFWIDQGEAALVRDTPVLGRVKNVVPGLKAAFVDIGDTRDGFLPLKELENLGGDLHEGQAILVNVAAEAYEDKGARLTTNISLAGDCLAFVRGREGIFISRQITDETQRGELKTFLEDIVADLGLPKEHGPWGCIVRTAAQNAEDEAIEEEFEHLTGRVKELCDLASSAKPPAILTNATARLAHRIERLGDKSLARIRMMDAELSAALKTEWAASAPGLASKVVLESEDPFEAEFIDEQIDEALADQVELPGGGWIAIETTKALTAIDVNSGKATGRDQERAALKINLEAAYEIARQVRLRALGGVIVIDFLRLREEGAGAKLTQTMQKAFASDPSPLRIGQISEFGLVEMTRRRDGLRLVELLTEETGLPTRLMKADGVADRIAAQLARERAGTPGARWAIRAHAEVIEVLNRLTDAQKERHLSGTELIADGALGREQFQISEA
jgi:ribonuclease G